MKAQVDELDVRLEIAAEDYNEASARFQEASQRAQKAERELKRVRARIAKLQGLLGHRAEAMYRHGPLTFLEVLMNTTDFQEFSATWDLLRDMNRKDAEAVAELKEARADAVRVEKRLTKAKAAAQSERDEMAGRKRAVETQLAERKRMLAGLEREVAELERAERRRAQQAAEAARRASLPSRGGGGNPTRAPRSQVVQIAMQHLGKPYQWAASGPDRFDCSGFTMYVYRQVGVSLPHSSRAQYNVGERVSRDNLQPGDLVFFGRSRIHHVGIYVGGGDYIHAPRTGDVVKISPLSYGDYAGATRP